MRASFRDKHSHGQQTTSACCSSSRFLKLSSNVGTERGHDTMAAQQPRAQTLKQAKAAYKSRSGSTLTAREKKQLERSIELDRRAWRVREAEKRKAEAKAKREEKERTDRENGVGMTSQRRCDRFGFVASQMHLGAFFGGGGFARERDVGQDEVGRERKASGDEDCFDRDLDDESMLNAVDEGNDAPIAGKRRTIKEPPRASAKWSVSGAAHSAKTAKAAANDLDFFWDDLDSSTQIAQDLAAESPAKAASKSASPNTSFGSGEFDLSVEDIEEAQAKDDQLARVVMDKTLMPPPALPVKPAVSKKSIPQAQSCVKPLRQSAQPSLPPPPAPQPKPVTPPSNMKKPAFAPTPYLGFTMAELESFVDDDLQLTQVAPV